MQKTLKKKFTLKPWLLAARPKTLFASLGPVILGTSLAFHFYEIFIIEIAIVTALCALLLQISSNYINDYFDGIRGIDSKNRLGPQRATAEGVISPKHMQIAFILTLSLSFLLGMYLMILGGAPIILIGFLSILFAYLYTGGPYPLSYHGLGELTAFIFFGPIATMGAHYLQSHIFDWNTFIIGSGVGFISALILGINNLRDIQSDKDSKDKKTLAVLFGEKFQRHLCLGFLLLSQLMVIIFVVLSKKYFVLIELILPLLFLKTWINIKKAPISSAMNEDLANTGKFLFLYCVTIAALINFKL